MTSPTPFPSEPIKPSPPAPTTSATEHIAETSSAVPSPPNASDDSPGTDFPGIVLAAVLALAATLFVQSVVAPWIARRSRRREHWEDRVSELSALVGAELPRLLERYRSAGNGRVIIESMMEHAENAREREYFDRELEARKQALKAADDDLDEPMDRLQRLSRRVVMFRRGASYWTDLQLLVQKLRVDLALLTTSWGTRDMTGVERHGRNNSEHFDGLWAAVKERRKQLERKVEEVAATLTLPPFPVRARIRYRIALWRRRTQDAETVPTQQRADA